MIAKGITVVTPISIVGILREVQTTFYVSKKAALAAKDKFSIEKYVTRKKQWIDFLLEDQNPLGKDVNI
ncbi:hypothetical protein KFK09_001762 [Dendrobium nobile]|uniref:Uncharacterized protein n=1 Tax=Dendrobium nobile TaxID=94219 RepID=A0A8T3CBT3_DENNO|nr:hypothetical protein KFK09_001762 [Dendrobium nobile]